MRRPVVLAVALATARIAAAGDVVQLAARTIERDGVTVSFPPVTYEAPRSPSGAAPEACARIASEALGTTVDPVRDLVAEGTHRVVLRDPNDPGRLLKVYRLDRAGPDRIARLIQRELGVQDLLQRRGIRLAPIELRPTLLRRGVLRQRRVEGRGLHEVYPDGYRIGDHTGVDRVLARVSAIDAPLRSIVSAQSGLLLTNTVDCHDERPVGVDLGHCYGNIFLETATGEPVFVDW